MSEDRIKVVVRLDTDLHEWFVSKFLRHQHGGIQWFLEETIRTAQVMYESGELQAPHDIVHDVVKEVYRRNL
jgi:hypothetical protein